MSEVTRQLPGGGTEVFRGFDADGVEADPPEAVGALIARYDSGGALISERVFRVERETQLGEWVEGQHPRGKGGKFAKKPRMGYFGPEIDGITVNMPDSPDKLGGWKPGEWFPTTGGSKRSKLKSAIGLTPFREGKDDKQKFYDDPRTKKFLADLKTEGKRYGVQVRQATPAEGVWVGGEEPSFSIRVQDGEDHTRQWTKALVKKYGQWAGVTFHEDDKGTGAFATFKGFNPKKQRKQLLSLLKKHKLEGATIRSDGTLELMGDGADFIHSLDDIGHDLGVNYDVVPGRFEVIENEGMA